MKRRCKKRTKKKLKERATTKKRRIIKDKREVFLLYNIYYNGIYYTIFTTLIFVINILWDEIWKKKKKIENYQN